MANKDIEKEMELKAASTSKYLLTKTINPIRRYELKKSIDMFRSHALGVELAVLKLKRGFEES